jgi:hypothetical protein
MSCRPERERSPGGSVECGSRPARPAMGRARRAQASETGVNAAAVAGDLLARLTRNIGLHPARAHAPAISVAGEMEPWWHSPSVAWWR